MSDMQFNSDGANEFGAPPTQSVGSDLTGKLVTWGLAANREQAQYILVGIGGIALVAALYFAFFSGGSSNVPTTPNWGTSEATN